MGRHGGPHSQTQEHLVDSRMGRPRQGQTGSGTRPQRRSPAPSTRRGPLATSRKRPPHPRGSLGSAALRPLRGRGGAKPPPPPERTPASARHATRYTAYLRLHGAGTGHRLLTWPMDPPDTLQEAEQVLGLMTKQVFQLKDTVPTPKPDVPAARDHPLFAPGHAPVQQPQGAPPQRGQPNARLRQGAKKRNAPAQAKPAPKPKAKSKSWTEEEAAALYPEYAIGTRVQLPFDPATAAGPSSGYGPQVRSSTDTTSPGTTRGSTSTSSGTVPRPTTRRWGAPLNSGKTATVLTWSPCSYAPPTWSTTPATSTRAKSIVHGP